MRIECPFPPSVNTYWRHNNGRTHISHEGRAYRDSVALLCHIERVKPIDGPLAMSVVIHPPDNRRRDVDNVLKALLDALGSGRAYQDDSQIVKLTIEKREKREPAVAIVDIESV